MKKQQGITLIALVITIIVLLILAGVSISMVIGNNGILNQASTASDNTRYATEQEQVELAFLSAKTKNMGGSVSVESINKALTENQVNATAKIKDGTTDVVLVVFNDTKNQYEVVGEIVTKVESSIGGGNTGITPEPVEIPEGLAVGDEVTYSPSGSYTWQAKYATSDDSITDATLSHEVSCEGSFNISTWKVLSVNEETGKVELVPSAATTGTVKLQGAQGYNNAVKLLNDACSDLYGNASKGITARSINMDDIENLYDGDFVEYYQTNYSPSSNGLGENYQVTSAYKTAFSNYPTIYAQEELSVINGAKKSEGTGLGRSEQSSFIERTDGCEKVDISTATSIQPYGTFRGNITLSSFLDSEYANLLTAGNYWVASRCVYVGSGDCGFSVSNVYGGYLGCNSIYYSHDSAYNRSLGLFPVVSLSSELLNSGSTTEWAVN